ncbi:MAG: hypothetical protein J1E81_09525 [Eubacterium sp.]|nr:hypothetical protein [Eubacterium sp.]
MKKTHFSKRLLSLFLAVMMLVTTAPLVPFTAQAATFWTLAASSDFTKATLGERFNEENNIPDPSAPVTPTDPEEPTDPDVPTDPENPSDGDEAPDLDDPNKPVDPQPDELDLRNGWYIDNVPNLNLTFPDDSMSTIPEGGVAQLSWKATKWADTELTSNGDGITIANGFLETSTKSSDIPYLDHSNAIKVDFAFEFTGNSNIDYDQTGFLTLGTVKGETPAKDPDYEYTWDSPSVFFGQHGDGRAAACGEVFNSYSPYNIAPEINPYLETGKTYHYIFIYEGGRLKAYLEDENEIPVVFLFDYSIDDMDSTEDDLDISKICYLSLGDDNNNYFYQNLCYKSVAVYAGNYDPDAVPPTEEADHYVFAYFTGDGEGQKVRIALSSDGHTFAPLDGNNPYLDSVANGEVYPTSYKYAGHNTYGSTGYARDPFIIKKVGEVGYWIVATDLRVYNDGRKNDYNNSRLLVWDVEKISEAKNVKPWNVDAVRMYSTDYRSNASFIAWAPEVVYDYNKNMYMLYWSGPLYDSSQILSAYTKDFKTFYNSAGNVINGSDASHEPDVFYRHNDQKVIDADIIYDELSHDYYMVYKCESLRNNDKAEVGTLWITKANTLQGLTNAQSKATKIQLNGVDANNKTLVFEGPELYQLNDGRWALITDQYSQNPLWDYYLIVADSLEEFFSGKEFIGRRDTSTNINDCLPRHGAVARVTEQTYKDLTMTSAIPDNFPNHAYAQGSFASNESYAGERNDYKNVLYVTDTAKSGSRQTTSNTYAQVANVPATVLYDGVPNSIQLGIMLAMGRNSSNRHRYPMWASITTADWDLIDNWHGKTGTNGTWNHYWAWASGDAGAYRISKTNVQPSGFKTWDLPYSITSGSYEGMSNFMTFTGNFAQGEYLKTYDSIGVQSYYNSSDNWVNNDVNVNVSSNNTVRVLNYKPIADAADEIKAEYAKVTENIEKYGIDYYCPESLDSYLAAVGKITLDINTFFINGDYYDKAAAHIQEIVENGRIELAKKGPSPARIRYGNLFHFDGFVSSGSMLTRLDDGRRLYVTNVSENTKQRYPISFDSVKGTISVSGAGDCYSDYNLKVDTYKIPVEPGKYIFEYSTDDTVTTANGYPVNNNCARAMVFTHDAAEASSDSAFYNAWTVSGAGSRKIVVQIPEGKKYVFFRFGVNGSNTPVTAVFNKIKFYKAEYEYWASNDINPENLIGGENNGRTGVPGKEIWYSTYADPELRQPTPIENMHFCNWYADEELMGYPVTTPADAAVNGCAILYPQYGEVIPLDTVVATGCVDFGSTGGSICQNCKAYQVEPTITPAKGHTFKWIGKIDDYGHYKFTCNDDHYDDLYTDGSVYETLEMIIPSLDPERFATSNEYQTMMKNSLKYFESLKDPNNNIRAVDYAPGPEEGTTEEIGIVDEARITSKLQEEIDKRIADMLNTLNEPVDQFELTFNVYVNGELKHTEKSKEDYNNRIKIFNATNYIPSGATVQAWSVSTLDSLGQVTSTKAIALYDAHNYYRAKFTTDSIINAYYVDEDRSDVVTICDQYGVPLYVFTADKVYVGYKDAGVTADPNYVYANGQAYLVPNMPFMTVTGFLANGAGYSGEYDLTQNGSVKIVPLWSAPETSYAITLDGDDVGAFRYDDPVDVVAENDPYALAIKVADGDYRIVAYGSQYSFFANRKMEFFTVNLTEDGAYTINDKNAANGSYTFTDDFTIFKLNNKLPFVYSAGKETDSGKYTTFSSYSTDLASKVQIIEVGTLYSLDIRDADDIVLDANGVNKVVSKTRIDPGNQYSLSIKGGIGKDITTRGYVKYSYVYQGATVVAVDYSNVCTTKSLAE